MSERAIPPGLVSVIVPSSGGLETLRRCVAELTRHARPPWELIVVSDGVGPVADYLAGVADAAPFRVEVARPASPAASGGFPASCAPGLAAARGEYLVLLADVAVVTDGWLAQLVGLAESGPRADLTGPVSNAAEPPQRVLAGSHGDAGELGRFASRWRHEHRGQWLTVESLSGPCLLLKRRVLESLGGPEGRGASDLLAGDLVRRAREAGFAAAVAYDLYVHGGPWPSVMASPGGEFIRHHGDPDTSQAPCGDPGREPSASGLRLVWEGDVDGLHSLGLINRSLCRALLGRGVDLGLSAPGVGVVTPERLAADPSLESRRGRPPSGGPPQVWVAHRWPPRLDRPPEGRWAFFQPWEYGSLPRAWLGAAREADEVWAYSRAVRDVYLDAGVPPGRVHVVPLGVDPEVFRPGCEPTLLTPGPGFRFLFVGGTIHRKGIDVLIAAYERAFTPGDGVGLVVQDMGARSFYRGQTAGAALVALRDRGYPVEHREEPLPPGALARLYAACDCAVQPYRGEGFALPVIEAMACGLPVIVTGAGPALDYVSEETAFLIPAQRVELAEGRVGDIATVGRPWLWEPDVEALAELMRRVASDPASARSRGEAAARSIRERFTWGHAAAAVESRARELAAIEPARTTVAIPRPATSPRVSLTMIVRDEEANLGACLGSAADLFDEVVVVDTGSRDRTPEIARSFGARVFDFVWVDDFAAARNAALARATGDYAFWLDADDVVDPPQRERLGSLLASLRHGDEASYVVRCACDPDREGGGGETVVDHIRLFPLREDVRWTYRVHEQILPALRRAGVPVRWSDVTVRHTGYTDPALRRRKLARDEAILLAELAERPGEPFVLFNLGAIAVERQEWRGALVHLRASLAGSAPSDSIVRKLHALIARCHQMLGETSEALAACAAGLGQDPEDAELWFREAVARRNMGDRDGAERCWRRVLTLRRPEKFSSMDAGIHGHLTRRNLAALAEERGDRDEAARQWSAVLSECPGDRDALRALARLAAERDPN